MEDRNRSNYFFTIEYVLKTYYVRKIKKYYKKVKSIEENKLKNFILSVKFSYFIREHRRGEKHKIFIFW